MNNDSIIFDDARLEKIWRRVLNGQGEQDERSMENILALEYELFALSHKLLSRYRALINPYIAEKSRRIRKLEARYYILTGKRYSKPAFSQNAADIRTLYDTSAALSALYTSTAVSAVPDIAAMYRKYANAETRFCGRILYIIEQSVLKHH